MNINRINSQKGIAQFLVIAVMAFLALGIPTATKLVQQNQENRSKAAEAVSPIDGVCGSINSSTLTSKSKTGLCVVGDASWLIDMVVEDKLYYSWVCFGLNGGKNADCKTSDEAISPDISGKCGSANGKTFELAPTSNLCEKGAFSEAFFNSPTKRYYWRCGDVKKLENAAAKCYATINEKTGSPKLTLNYEYVILGVGQTTQIKAKIEPADPNTTIKWSSSRPEAISVDPNGTITVLKDTDDGYVTATTSQGQVATVQVHSVDYTYKVDGMCGSANGKTFSSTPYDNVCTNGVEMRGNIIGNKFIWTCYGTNGGKISDCEATITNSVKPTSTPRPIGINGVCGTIKYSQLSKNSPNDKNLVLCKSGKVDDFFTVYENGTNGDLTYVWNCLGSNGGSDIQCNVANNEKITPTPIPIISGAYLYFSPQNQSRKIGDTFEVAVGVNSASSIIGGADVVGNYDSSKLELISIKKSPSMVFGDKGDCEISKDLVPGKFMLTCYLNDTSQAKATKGDLVNLTFKTKSDGSAKIEFACEKNNNTDSNIIGTNPVRDIILCNKNINANIVITGSPQTKIDGKCSTGLNKCLSGTFKDLPDSTTLLVWQCSGSNGGKSVKCSIKHNLTTPPPKITPEINENGGCGDVTKIITNTCVSGNPIDLPDTLNEYIWECKGAKTTQRCVKIKGSDDDLCPKNQFNHWGKCENDLEIGWGCDRDGVCISGKCDLTTNRCVNKNFNTPATSIRISPLGLSLKVGQNRNLTYVLSPGSSTDTVKWSTTGSGLIRIQKITFKCADNPNAKCIDVPGINNLLVTGLKAGTVKIKLTTSSGKTAQATVVVQK